MNNIANGIEKYNVNNIVKYIMKDIMDDRFIVNDIAINIMNDNM